MRRRVGGRREQRDSFVKAPFVIASYLVQISTYVEDRRLEFNFWRCLAITLTKSEHTYTLLVRTVVAELFLRACVSKFCFDQTLGHRIISPNSRNIDACPPARRRN